VKINSPVRNLDPLRKDLQNRSPGSKFGKNAPFRRIRRTGRFRKPQLITVPKRCLKRNPKNQENNKRRQRLSFCFQDKQFPYFVKMLFGGFASTDAGIRPPVQAVWIESFEKVIFAGLVMP
jgi:hypothetical protein